MKSFNRSTIISAAAVVLLSLTAAGCSSYGGGHGYAGYGPSYGSYRYGSAYGYGPRSPHGGYQAPGGRHGYGGRNGFNNYRRPH